MRHSKPSKNKMFHRYAKKQHIINNNTHLHDITFKCDETVITGVCPICRQNTYYDPSNIIVGSNIFHFDCVFEWVRDNFGVDKGKKIYYIGSKSFGIFWESKNGKKLEMLKRINLEEYLNTYAR
ncbi:MAG: hypothetical protein N3D81_02850 [Spirochaetes bacterium]|nr:hypothetical protein [Spirochaetota bacterium]